MEAIIKTLLEACRKVGVAPSKPFADVQAFRDHVHQSFAPPGRTLSREQLVLLQDAIIQAAHHDVNAVVEHLKRLKAS